MQGQGSNLANNRAGYNNNSNTNTRNMNGNNNNIQQQKLLKENIQEFKDSKNSKLNNDREYPSLLFLDKEIVLPYT